MTEKKILDFCNRYSCVYCYGAGVYGKITRFFLSENHIEIDGFLVSNNVCINKILEIPVYSLADDLDKLDKNAGVVISASESKQSEMISLLSQKNFFNYLCVTDDFINTLRNQLLYEHKYTTQNNITIFCYHRVADIPLDTWKLSVSPSLFNKQVEYIKNHYCLMRTEEDWKITSNERAAIITFDDGYYDSYENALPILEKHGVPATFFVCTGNIDTDKEFWWDDLERIIFYSDKKDGHILIDGIDYDVSSMIGKTETCYRLHPLLKRMQYQERNNFLVELSKTLGSTNRNYCRSLNSEQLLKLSGSSLITIGGHTVTHSCLANETLSDQEWEITESKKIIEDIIGRKLEVFSYPFGQREDFTADTVEIAKKTGYKKIFAAFEGLSNSAFQNGYIPRINIGQEKDYFDSIRLLRYYETIYGDV